MSVSTMIIGATGTVGGAVLRRLRRDRIGVRTVSRRPGPSSPKIDAVTGDVSILGSHRRIESLIKSRTNRFCFLRPGGFAANTLAWAEQLRHRDELRWIFAQARRSLIHEDDIADVAALALQGGAAGTSLHLTGPESISQIEQLRQIGAATGRQLRFLELPPDRARAELFSGLPADLAESIMTGQAAFLDTPEPVTDTVAKLTGSPARPFSQWAASHAVDLARIGGADQVAQR